MRLRERYRAWFGWWAWPGRAFNGACFYPGLDWNEYVTEAQREAWGRAVGFALTDLTSLCGYYSGGAINHPGSCEHCAECSTLAPMIEQWLLLGASKASAPTAPTKAIP